MMNDLYDAASYTRLSREDGDRVESDSIINQQRLIEDYCVCHTELHIVDHYSDDGYTGTNFDRPGFKRMLDDIKAGKVNCVLVKDLSRFGRDYIDMGYYLERVFPALNVRFIAINDNVDSKNGPYDMLLPLKNVFNAQYAKDISSKVRSAFTAKQNRGEFVGAFASYGYIKDPQNHNRLVVDPVASKVVYRIFEMAAQGIGKIRIAKILNDEQIPCPSEYKRLMGEKYTNNHRLKSTQYWTYSTIHRMLNNEMYIGNMVQRRCVRAIMHGKATATQKKDWAIVPNTHEAIISQILWDTVQAQLNKNTRELNLQENIGLFAGFICCGDCGRAMVKTKWNDRISYSCGSYRRYGRSVCSAHNIPQKDIEAIVLNDLNRIIAAVQDLHTLAETNQRPSVDVEKHEREQKRLTAALERIQRLKQRLYEDYRDQLLSRDEFLRYKADYDEQEASLVSQIEQANRSMEENSIITHPWVERLLKLGKLTELDRPTLAQTVKKVRVFENNRLEITYLFSEDLRILLEAADTSS